MSWAKLIGSCIYIEMPPICAEYVLDAWLAVIKKYVYSGSTFRFTHQYIDTNNSI